MLLVAIVVPSIVPPFISVVVRILLGMVIIPVASAIPRISRSRGLRGAEGHESFWGLQPLPFHGRRRQQKDEVSRS